MHHKQKAEIFLKKVVQKNKLENFDQIKKNLEYWLSLPVSERLSAVEKLRKHNMEVQKDFKEFLEYLNKNNVEYVIVGACALAFYGMPRYTGDIDILINPYYGIMQSKKDFIKSVTDLGNGQGS